MHGQINTKMGIVLECSVSADVGDFALDDDCNDESTEPSKPSP